MPCADEATEANLGLQVDAGPRCPQVSQHSWQWAWGKSPRGHGEPAQWLPLSTHLTDAAAVARGLWRHWAGPHVQQLLAEEVGSAELVEAVVVLAAGMHDIGKLTPAFARQVPQLQALMEEHGFTFHPGLTAADSRALPHSLAGHVVLQGWLGNRGMARPAATAFAVLTGGHHGLPPQKGSIQDARRRPLLMGDRVWAAERLSLIEYVVTMTETWSAVDRLGEIRLSQPAQVLMTGLVIMADWIASSELFPLVPVGELVTESSADRADAALSRLRLPTPWQADYRTAQAGMPEMLHERFPATRAFPARPVQELAVTAAATMSRPGLLLIEAAMGEGKTEAALLAAEVLAARFSCNGLLVALPTRATADAMFGRVLDWVDRVPDQSGDPTQSLLLRHGSAALNPSFLGVYRQKSAACAQAGAAATVDESGMLSATATELTDVGRGEVVGNAPNTIAPAVHDWLRGRKKAALADFTVGTIDQLLFAALQARHLVLRHLGVARQVVILDEVHACDLFMQEFLERAVEWLGAYRVPVIALSATLPAAQRAQLVQAYERGAGQAPTSLDVSQRDSDEPDLSVDEGEALPTPQDTRDYPLVSYVEGDVVVHRTAPLGDRQLEVGLEWLSDDIEALRTRLAEELVDGGCALVVCNTVRRAIDRYEALKDSYGDEVRLAHSRFVASDRLRIDEWLRSAFGPPSTNTPVPRPHRAIVVATQVAEQSLDVDFDLLVTDLAPMDLLLQRMGRLHRHHRGNSRPPQLRSPRCLVTAFASTPDGPPTLDRGGRRVYGEHLLLRAAALVNDRSMIRLPADIAPLVQDAYSSAPLGPATWQATMERAWTAEAERRQSRRQMANTYRLGSPQRDGDLVGWLTAADGGNDEAAASRAVRDADDAVEVVLAYRDGAGARLLPHLGDLGRIPGDRRPTDAQANALARSVVRLPGYLLDRGRAEDVLRALQPADLAGWRTHPLLAHSLVLALDPPGAIRLAGWHVSYSPTTGLEVSREPTA